MLSTDFMTLLRKSGLMSTAQLGVALALSHEREAADALGAELVRQGLLTSWQAAQLLKGQTGFVLQHYKLLEAIGKGGMGHVFKAIDSRDSSIVAVKVMSRKLSSNQNLVNRFRREIRASSRLNCPWVVRTIDAGRVGKIDFMVMEFVNGDQLDNILQKVSTLPASVACEIARQAALGLQHAHEQKMVHRDIKPANLMIDWTSDNTGVVKIMDMGLVRLSEDDEERTAVTRAGQVMGTPDYMSPEQGWNTATVDIRSDIYSLGCTLFRLLTGKVPFPGENPLQVLMARCSRDVPPASSLRPELAEPIDLLVQKMTRRDPQERFQTPAEVAAALQPWCAPLTVDSLKKLAASQPGAETVVLLQSFSRSDFSESQDPGYQQFLKAMETGAAVDLMLANTPSAGFELSPTIPIIRPGKSATTKTSSGKSSPGESSGPRRTRSAGLIALAAVTVLTLLIAAFVGLRGNSRPGSQTANAKTQTGNTAKTAPQKKTAPPTARLAAPEPLRLKAGDNLDVIPQFEDKPPEPPKAGKLVWKTGNGTPAGVTIDPDSGRIQWKIPDAFAVASYSIPVELHFELNGKQTLVSSTALVVTLQAGTVEYKFGQSGPIQLEPGQTFNWKSDLIPAPEPKMKYRLSGDKPPGHNFNETKGELLLQPQQGDLGKFNISMELLNEDGSAVLAKVTRSVLVLPKNLTLTLPTIPEQRTRAGETLKVPLFPAPSQALRKLLTLKLIAPPGVVGAEIDNASGTFTWTVPGNTRDSRFEFIVEAASAIPELSLSGTAPLSTRIPVTVGAAPAGSAAPATAQTPDPAAVEKAETALKEQYKKELSSTGRPKFVRRLLELQYEQPPGPDDFALLKLVIETDSKARVAADGILEALRIREERYGIAGLTETLQVASQFKGTPAAAQQDRIIELLLLAALDAASAQRWADVVTLLKLPADLTKRPRNNSGLSGMADGLRQAESLANSLASGNGQADAVKQTDLLSLLRRWQFQRNFSGAADLRYMQSGNAADQLPDSGRSLWKFSATGLDLAGPRQKVAVGILEPASLPARWVHRMQVHGSTSSLAVLLGASGETQISALLLTLDASAPGRVTPLSGGADLLPRNSSINVPRDAWNDFEISVDGKALRVRMNGELLCQGTLAALNQGRLGLLIPPTDSPQPAVRIRRPRLLLLPDTP
ncbi:MAG: protein kinase domain-containing protein [Planctomycetaceae bacterium]